MSALIITRGLPASGKTTIAREWVQAEPSQRIRLNRDELRRMLHADTGQTTNGLHEDIITKAQHDAARQALRSGYDVIVDDTNLRSRTANDWATLADVVGADFKVIDLTAVTAEECIRRNRQRPFEDQVPEEVIVTMDLKYLHGRSLPEPKPRTVDAEQWTPYEPIPDRPAAYLIDIDGTVAIKGDRDIYDGTKVHLDTENHDVTYIIRMLQQLGHRMIYMSGRSKDHREGTLTWLAERGLRVDDLHMRTAGDHRRDSVVKHELFNDRVREHYRILGVFDDRNQVVEMWRAIGLTVFQVADGNF